MESDEKESQVVFPPEVFGIRVDDPEVLKACWYLMQRDQNKTIEEIGLVLGYSSRQSVYNLVHKWEDSGVLKKAREIYLIPKGRRLKLPKP
jgi:predicted transcriptional regulator